ncbi:hypothetical protein D3C72_1941480 [compost metagenome]
MVLEAGMGARRYQSDHRQRDGQHRLGGKVQRPGIGLAPAGVHETHAQWRVFPALLGERQPRHRLRPPDQLLDQRVLAAGVGHELSGLPGKLLDPAAHAVGREHVEHTEHRAERCHEDQRKHDKLVGLETLDELHDGLPCGWLSKALLSESRRGE